MAKLTKNKIDVVDAAIKQHLMYGEEIKKVGDDFPFYYATSYGRIFSNKQKIDYKMQSGEVYTSIVWKELKQRKTSKDNSYLSVNLYDKNGKKVRRYVHHLVFKAFNNNSLMDFNTIKIVHIDKNKENNRLNNLQIAWRKQTAYQDHRNYTYKSNMIASLTEY